MDEAKLKRLIRMVEESDIDELEIRPFGRIRIAKRRAESPATVVTTPVAAPVASPPPAATAASPAAAEAPPAAAEAPGTPEAEPQPPGGNTFWLLSLFCPGAAETIDWKSGDYSLITRGGRIESLAASGAEKRLLRMVAEGSVLVADTPPVGRAPSVAPVGFPHPVFRYGFPVDGCGKRLPVVHPTRLR